MILILSKSQYEHTTIDIMNHLDKLGGNYIRVNGDDLLTKGNVTANINEGIININNRLFDAKDINVVFNRRWFDREDITYEEKIVKYKNCQRHEMLEALKFEFSTLSQFFKSSFSKSTWIPDSTPVNKLKVLLKAKNIGLLIPETYICSTKTELEAIFQQHSTLITKSIGDLLPIHNNKNFINFLTKEITQEVLENLPNTFFPSLFQKRIDKEYEVRIFYFFGKCYSMAIFSQRDKSTSVDFRNYNDENPNRTVPYSLPVQIEKKVVKLMRQLNLNTGSIDLMKNNRGYYFLEVNPTGQFGMIEYPCNYPLAKIVAQKLIELDEKQDKN
jgi:ATP-GRASP peptide maturase of grasp-with-spasm system